MEEFHSFLYAFFFPDFGPFVAILKTRKDHIILSYMMDKHTCIGCLTLLMIPLHWQETILTVKVYHKLDTQLAKLEKAYQIYLKNSLGIVIFPILAFNRQLVSI